MPGFLRNRFLNLCTDGLVYVLHKPFAKFSVLVEQHPEGFRDDKCRLPQERNCNTSKTKRNGKGLGLQTCVSYGAFHDPDKE